MKADPTFSLQLSVLTMHAVVIAVLVTAMAAGDEFALLLRKLGVPLISWF